MTRELQSTLEASGIEWPALRHHMPCVAHVVQLAVGAFMSSLGVKGHTKSWVAHQSDQQFGENETIDIGNSQTLRRVGNARINKVSAMKPGLARIIEKVRISWYFESPGIDLHIAENACCIEYTDTWSSKWVHWLPKTQSPHRGTSDYGCEDRLQFYTGVARARLLITGIHMRVAPKSKIQWLQATFHNSRCMDHCEVCYGSIEAISILDPVDVDEAFSLIASRYHSAQWQVRSSGWRQASVGTEEGSMEGRLVLRCEDDSTEAVQILHWSNSNDRYASHICTYLRSFLDVVIV